MNFLIWNLNRQALATSVASLAEEHVSDVVILVENTISPVELLERLNEPEFEFEFAPGRVTGHGISIFTRFPSAMLTPMYEDERITIRRAKLPIAREFLLVAVHMPSKRHMTTDDQEEEMRRLADVICEMEEAAGHSRTVLLGDLNMNPFEPAIVKPRVLNGVMSRSIARRRERIVSRRPSNPFFYNPMWSLFGDFPEPPGTYYHVAKHLTYYWNLFDQVLIRPDLAAGFQSETLRIVDRAGGQSLLTKSGIPDRKSFSDHLPIAFSIEL